MGKLIIDNRSDASDAQALMLVLQVVQDGRVSNGGKQYCYGTVFENEGRKYAVWTDLNTRSDRFTVTNKL